MSAGKPCRLGDSLGRQEPELGCSRASAFPFNILYYQESLFDSEYPTNHLFVAHTDFWEVQLQGAERRPPIAGVEHFST